MRHCRAGIIQPGERYIIAVGAGAIRLASLEQTIPRIVSTVLPFGPEQVHIDRESGQPGGSFPFGREYWFEDGQLHWLDHRP